MHDIVLRSTVFESPSYIRNVSIQSYPRTDDVLIFQGSAGTWRNWAGNFEGGFYVCGAEIRYQEFQGLLLRQDDSAANGLRVTYCSLADWNNAISNVTIWTGDVGEWQGMQMCPEGSFVDGAQVRYQSLPAFAVDATGLNGLRIRCRDSLSNETEWVEVYAGNRGVWRTEISHDDKFAKLLKVQYEGICYTTLFCDNTALNGLQFRMETPNLGIENYCISDDSCKDSLMAKTRMHGLSGSQCRDQCVLNRLIRVKQIFGHECGPCVNATVP